MHVVMIGTGYVGLVTGTCLADSGNDVTCVDIDAEKVDRLKRGEIPIYEPGLEDMIRRNVQAGRLSFTTDASEAVPGADCVFIAVGTPQGDDGAADLDACFQAVRLAGAASRTEAVVVIKSTVPVGTNRAVKRRLDELTGRDVDVASNPEFLKEGPPSTTSPSPTAWSSAPRIRRRPRCCANCINRSCAPSTRSW